MRLSRTALVAIVAVMCSTLLVLALNEPEETNLLTSLRPEEGTNTALAGTYVEKGKVTGRVLAFTDVAETMSVERALELLGVEYEIYRDEAGFFDALTEGGWDLAIVETPRGQHDWGPLISWVEGGGRLIASMWRPGQEFLEAMEATAIGDVLTSPLQLYSWETHGSLFSGLQEVPSPLACENFWNENGHRMEPRGEAVALAGFTSSEESDQAATILGNEGRTLMNGFLFDDYRGFDEDTDGVDDILEFFANEAAYLLGAVSPSLTVVERPLEPGVAVTGEVSGKGFPWVEEGISGYLEYTVTVTEAWALAIHLQGEGNLDLYVRAGRPIGIEEGPTDGWIVDYDLAALSSGGGELLVIAEPKQDTRYWIAVENKGDEAANYSLVVHSAPLIESLTLDGAEGAVRLEDVPAAFQSLLYTDRGMLSSTQYRLIVPADGQGIRIEVEGTGPWHLYLRKGEPVAIAPEGVVSDLSFGLRDAGEFYAGGILPAGDYYLALEALAPPQSYSLSVFSE